MTTQFSKVVQELDASKSRGVILWLDSKASKRTQDVKRKINSNENTSTQEVQDNMLRF